MALRGLIDCHPRTRLLRLSDRRGDVQPGGRVPRDWLARTLRGERPTEPARWRGRSRRHPAPTDAMPRRSDVVLRAAQPVTRLRSAARHDPDRRCHAPVLFADPSTLTTSSPGLCRRHARPPFGDQRDETVAHARFELVERAVGRIRRAQPVGPGSSCRRYKRWRRDHPGLAAIALAACSRDADPDPRVWGVLAPSRC